MAPAETGSCHLAGEGHARSLQLQRGRVDVKGQAGREAQARCEMPCGQAGTPLALPWLVRMGTPGRGAKGQGKQLGLWPRAASNEVQAGPLLRGGCYGFYLHVPQSLGGA